jgi:glutamate-5-semialdehyde dehydrogenase
MSGMRAQAERVRSAWRVLSVTDAGVKNAALSRVPHEIEARSGRILEANRRDVENARKNGSADAFIERLTMNEKRIAKMIAGIHEVIALEDPVGAIIDDKTLEDGLRIVKRRVPLGVIAIIYESRPDVTVDAAALCVKSGNAVILRGGSEAFGTNCLLTEAVRSALEYAGLPPDCVSMVADTSRDTAAELMGMNEYIDVLIPRGGKGLIDFVVRNSTIPVIQTGDGI